MTDLSETEPLIILEDAEMAELMRYVDSLPGPGVPHHAVHLIARAVLALAALRARKRQAVAGGNWHVGRSKDGKLMVMEVEAVAPGVAASGPVATVHALSEPLRERRAQLIAAAPKMRAALDAALSTTMPVEYIERQIHDAITAAGG